jgi:hypothetical protein
MEFSTLLALFRRWGWLALLPTLIAGGYALATYRAPAAGYTLALRYTAGQSAMFADRPEYDPNYYRWLTSEYIVGALKDWVKTGQFAAAVQARLVAMGHPEPLGAIVAADNARSILVIYLSGSDPEALRLLAEAVTAELQHGNAAVFPQLGGQAAVVTLLDPPAPALQAPSLRERLDPLLKGGVGLFVGLGLMCLAHFLDPYVRDRADAEQTGLSVIGEIPKAK